jgi:hypothetical protein
VIHSKEKSFCCYKIEDVFGDVLKDRLNVTRAEHNRYIFLCTYTL